MPGPLRTDAEGAVDPSPGRARAESSAHTAARSAGPIAVPRLGRMPEKTKLEKRLGRLVSAVRKSDGFARTATLLGGEWSEYDIAQAVRRSLLQRVRKGWVALPSADADLRAVARAGVVLTCLTQAKRLGLWVLDGGSVSHVGAPAHAGGVKTDGFHVHWRTPPVPRNPD